MTDIISSLRQTLSAAADVAVAESNKRFFKEGEHFLCYGLKSADVNKIAKRYAAETKALPKGEVLALCESLWQSGYQEEAGVACAFTEELSRLSEPEDFAIYADWLNIYVRNWAMCDTFCNHTIGDLVMKFPELAEPLFDWTRSDNRWVKRGAAVTLVIPARRGLFLPLVFRIADAMLQDTDDMAQKGYGWMLKAAAEAHEQEVFEYVRRNKAVMPRTALRYAIEKMPPELKKIAMARE